MSAEDRVRELLRQQLPVGYTIYANATWLEKEPGNEPADGEADLVIGHSGRGILVVEVKGGGVRRIGQSDRWESVDRAGQAHAIKNPFRQVTREMHALRRVAEDLPEWPVSPVRFARAVAFPDIDYDRGVVPNGPPEIVIDRGDLPRLQKRVEEIFDWWSRTGDAEDYGSPGEMGMRALRTLLARDVEIRSPLSHSLAESEATIIRLTEQQMAVLDFLTAQRRALVLGVAGSGKTLLAAEKARRLAAQGFRVLLTCFNRPLAEYLAQTVGQYANLDVSTFHRLAEEWGQRAGIVPPVPVRDSPAYFDALPDALDRALQLLPEPRYDAIIVDEAQDIDAEWWLPLLDLLADSQRGIVHVFGDANQDLYHAREPDELGVLMPDRPAPFYLTENRRSTRAIHDFAARFAPPLPVTDGGPPAARALGPAGEPVEVMRYAGGDSVACLASVSRALHSLIDIEKVTPGDIVVLTPRSRRSSWLMREDLGPVAAGAFRLMPESIADGAVAPWPTRQNEVRVATIHRFKGLESSVVVLAEIDSRIPSEDRAGLLYVGATRARAHLVVIGSAETLGQLGVA
jgi:hypothetical protein